jgi:hypothetical protein
VSAAHDGIPGAAGATVAQARFASALAFDQLPAEVVERTKTCVLDTLGCCLFGSTQPSVRTLTTMVAGEDSGGSAILMGAARRASASMAALVNATAAHSFQLDEIHIQATLHPGSAALPAVLAVAQCAGRPVSGREAITALVAGYETALRTGMAARGSIFTRGYHNQGATGGGDGDEHHGEGGGGGGHGAHEAGEEGWADGSARLNGVEGPGGEVGWEGGWLHAGQGAGELGIGGRSLGAGGAALEVLSVRGGQGYPLG